MEQHFFVISCVTLFLCSFEHSLVNATFNRNFDNGDIIEKNSIAMWKIKFVFDEWRIAIKPQVFMKISKM